MEKFGPWRLWLAVSLALGLWVRLYHISANQFLFYDEGMYLGYNRGFLNLVANNPPRDFNEFLIIIGLMFKAALTTAKALWFFLLNVRVFLFGPESWFFARWVSASAGFATIVLIYFWAKRYFHSQRIAALSALFLLVLPSHVFYSRLGMQEALSTLLFLGAIYLYMGQRRIGWRFFVSVLLLSGVFFTNYRMIIAPLFVVLVELWTAFLSQEKRRWLKLICYVVLFYGLVFFVGSLYGGANSYITLAWMFHQAQDTGGRFEAFNFLSYPYYVFVLEGFLFASLFWANMYFVVRKQWGKLLPFGIVLVQMFLFSFAPEKGVRYLCVVLPFMAVAVAVVVDYFWQKCAGKARVVFLTTGILALGTMVYLSALLALARTDYEKAVRFIVDRDPEAIILSTQPLVERLYVRDEDKIVSCPKDLASVVDLYKKGARYLIVDPQAYISWTADGQRFSPPLNEFLELVRLHVPPIQEFSHLNKAMLTRFVLDHNEQLVRSMAFLANAGEGFGRIRIYDLRMVLRYFFSGKGKFLL